VTVPLAIRVPLAVLALAIAVFAAVQLSAEHRLKDNRDVVIEGLPRGDERREDAIRKLEDVAGVQPGTEALLAASGARTSGGEVRRGAALARRAVEREPDNFGAWLTLAIALKDTDRAAALDALERAHRLNPRYRLPSLR
jgi:cytochrome c-type biogenesis protein CcmH/NrfG